jgi:hypothetical protein
MWDLSIKPHQQYLAKTIDHYQRMLLAKKGDEQIKMKHIINQYSHLLT